MNLNDKECDDCVCREVFRAPLLFKPIKFQTLNEKGEVIVVDLDRTHISVFNFGNGFYYEGEGTMNSRGTYTKFGSFDPRDSDTFKQRLFGLLDACNVHTYCGAPDVQSLVRYIMDCIHLYGVNENERRTRRDQ